MEVPQAPSTGRGWMLVGRGRLVFTHAQRSIQTEKQPSVLLDVLSKGSLLMFFGA